MVSVINFNELSFFARYDTNVAEEFCDITFQYLHGNFKSRAYSSAAQKLGTDPETVQSVVEKLADLMLQCSKVEVQHEELLELLQGVVPEEVAELFWRRLQSDGPALRLLLRQVRPQRVTYDSLDWRLQCTLASRSLLERRDVDVVLRLGLRDGDAPRRHRILRCDVANLKHLTDVLQSALDEAKSSHVRKVLRYGK